MTRFLQSLCKVHKHYLNVCALCRLHRASGRCKMMSSIERKQSAAAAAIDGMARTGQKRGFTMKASKNVNSIRENNAFRTVRGDTHDGCVKAALFAASTGAHAYINRAAVNGRAYKAPTVCKSEQRGGELAVTLTANTTIEQAAALCAAYSMVAHAGRPYSFKVIVSSLSGLSKWLAWADTHGITFLSVSVSGTLKGYNVPARKFTVDGETVNEVKKYLKEHCPTYRCNLK